MHIASLKEVVSADEWTLRCDLAACYRLVAAYGWSDLVFTHISARVPGEDNAFLINPYGLLFSEVTASCLVKIDLDGNKVEPSDFEVNRAGFVIHSAVHAGRPDALCVLHTHSRAGVAVSAQKCGVLPISQQSTFVLASLAYHDYEGVADDVDEQARLVADMGRYDAMILRASGQDFEKKDTIYPNVHDGVEGMYFIQQCVASSAQNGAWVNARYEGARS